MNTELATTEPGTVVLSRREVARFEPNEEQRRMIRATYANGASDDEFQVLMEIARARNLNPLLRQIHFVSRWQPGGNVWAPQVSIDGLRAIAERTGLYAGQDKPVYTENPDGTLLCCEVAVYRKDWTRPVWGVAYWVEYVQMTKDRTTGKERPAAMWAKMPHVMLAKVAESIALRKAFPEDAGGLYTDDEMGQADNGRPDQGGAEEPKVTTTATRARSKASLPPPAEAQQLGAGNAAESPTIPAELAAFHAALPSLAKPADGVALWIAHRPALNAAAEGPRKAAWTELAKALTKFGGGVGSFSAAKGYLKTSLADHDEKAKAAEPQTAQEPSADDVAQGRAANDPDTNHSPEVHTPAEAPAVEASASQQHPAVVAFLAAVAAIELPGEGVAAWMQHRATLGPLPVADREVAWKALVAQVEKVGKMSNASAWLKKAVAQADADAQAAAAASGEPAGLPGDVMQGLLADIGMARDATVLAQVWAAVAEKEWHDATPGQRVQLETARTAREKALRTPPTPPKGTRTRSTTAPADANGSGAAANDAAEGARTSAGPRLVLDADEAEARYLRDDAVGAEAWAAHLAACAAIFAMAGSHTKRVDAFRAAGVLATRRAQTLDAIEAREGRGPEAAMQALDGYRTRRVVPIGQSVRARTAAEIRAAQRTGTDG